jgi:putative ABC transport system ATP-binding protein
MRLFSPAAPLLCNPYPNLETDMGMVILRQVAKAYRLDTMVVPALHDINLEIRANCFTVISGPSGSGKTTLLNLIGCIDQPDHGDITISNETIHQ